MTRHDHILTWIERLLLLAGGLLLAAWAATVLEARGYGMWQERRLDRMIRMGPSASEPRAALGDEPGTGLGPAPKRADELVGRLEVPRLGLRAIVAEGVSSRTLRRAVGHVPGTALPGESGNVVMAGHRDTFFRPLKDVKPGDAVQLTTPQGRFEYTVESTEVVEPDRTDVLDAAGGATLTLVTCYPFYLVGHAPERFVVRARQVASARPEAALP